jgi:putative RNA 2'-phosphotransferase
MNPSQRATVSKFLSKHLRHEPETLGLALAEGGWVEIDALLNACAAHGFPIGLDQLDEVVKNCEKKRFAFDESGTRVRANQGHSTPVDLQFQPVTPPASLFHGTGEKNIPQILALGLLKMNRHHVHLSLDVATARKVGQRHGKPVVFVIDCAAMHARGHLFYRSVNGVWLSDHVPTEFLSLLDGAGSV